MLYVRMENGRAVEARTQDEFDATERRRHNLTFETRHDWKTLERATEVAQQLTDARGTLYIAIDNGRNVSPRYDVIAAPRVGDLVSKGFNGDYYPEGEIVSISASLKRIVTSTGCVFYRKRQTGAWIQDRTWTLVQGVRNERNPSF